MQEHRRRPHDGPDHTRQVGCLEIQPEYGKCRTVYGGSVPWGVLCENTLACSRAFSHGGHLQSDRRGLHGQTHREHLRPTYTKAFGATLLKNLVGWTALAVFGLYFQAPVIVTLIVGVALVPIAIYRFVFACMWREAALVWLGAFVVEVAAGYALTLVGLVKLAAITGG